MKEAVVEKGIRLKSKGVNKCPEGEVRSIGLKNEGDLRESKVLSILPSTCFLKVFVEARHVPKDARFGARFARPS
jgi:hypothetical protein